MKRIKEIYTFYRNIFLAITLINILFYIFFGSYLEDYETFFSSFLHGTYTKPWGLELDCSAHLGLLYLYEFIQQIFPTFNVYGIILFVYNWLSLSLLGLVLYRILKINLEANSPVLFVALYSILCLDNFVNIHVTRETFVLMLAVTGYIESCRFENKEITIANWCLIIFVILFATLIRFESVWLFSIIYIIVLVIFKRFTKSALLSFFISGFVLLVYYNILTPKINEAKQVYIYKEREIYDRDNIDYAKLSKSQLLEVTAMMEYGITDKEYFTLDFYDSIGRHNASNGILSLSDGIKSDSFKASFNHSVREFYLARYFFIFYFLSVILILVKKHPSQKVFILYAICMSAIPFGLCLYTIVPLRFLVPYLAAFGCLNVFFYIHYFRKDKIIVLFSVIFMLLHAYPVLTAKYKYKQKDSDFHNTIKKLTVLHQKQASSIPVIINNFYPGNYFPVHPLKKLERQHALFLNFYMFTAWDNNISSWKEVCNCHPLSLREKVNYIVINQNLFLISELSFEFLKKYFNEKYHIQLQKTTVEDFDGDIKVCKLNYDITDEN